MAQRRMPDIVQETEIPVRSSIQVQDLSDSWQKWSIDESERRRSLEQSTNLDVNAARQTGGCSINKYTLLSLTFLPPKMPVCHN